MPSDRVNQASDRLRKYNAGEPNEPGKYAAISFEDALELANAYLGVEKQLVRLKSVLSMLTSNIEESLVETVKRVSDENIRLRALLQKAHDEFAKTDHWYHSDIKEELAKELGL